MAVLRRQRSPVRSTGSADSPAAVDATKKITMASPGPKRKLPKMNPSERAKYYRRRIRDYMNNLETTDSNLTLHVENLKLIRHIQHELVGVASACHLRILSCIWHFLDHRRYLDQHILSDPRFEVVGLNIGGDTSGIVIRLDTQIKGHYSQDTIEKKLYTFIPGNTLLLSKLLRSEVTFESSFRFCFGPDGELVRESSETDFVMGLMQSIPCLPNELRQLIRALGNPNAIHSTAYPPVPPAPAFLRFADAW